MKYWLKLFAPGLGFLFFISCAQIVTPSGGPKDDAPPLILEMNPEPLSTNFTGNTIEIEFNEYIKLHEPATQILISPPQRKTPEYAIKKKSLIVKFKDTLMENTTYTINFGEAIRDNNEGNILGRLTYVFSTGTYLDSMQIEGKVTHAFDGSNATDALVMLYDQNVDSLPLDTLPLYFTRTDESGHFKLEHLKNVKYKVFALKDENANYIYDVLDEEIAFMDSMVVPDLPPIRPDTALHDSLVSDSIMVDKIPLMETDSVELHEHETHHLDLFMFAEDDTVQYLKKYNASVGKLLFQYNMPVAEFRVSPITKGLPKNWRLKEYSTKRDSVTLWTIGVEADSLILQVQADGFQVDTVEFELPKPDTGVAPQKPTTKVRGRSKVDDGRMKVKFAGNGRAPKPGQPMVIQSTRPVSKVSVDSIRVMKDSIPVAFRLELEEGSLKQFNLHYEQVPESKYELRILPNTFLDLNGQPNTDTLMATYTAMQKEDLGSVQLDVAYEGGFPLIIQLLTESGNLVHEQSIGGSATISVKALSAGKYSVKAIYDENGNGKWDTGRYRRKQQPEKAVFYSGQVEVRPNWDLEAEWDLSKTER